MYYLTPGEYEVFLLAAKNKTIRQICSELGLSQNTTEVHLKRIRKKLGATKDDFRDMLWCVKVADKRLYRRRYNTVTRLVSP